MTSTGPTTTTQAATAAALPDRPCAAPSRRDALRAGATGGAAALLGLSLGAIPIGLAATPRRARAQATNTPLQVLQFAYLLENIEAEFYKAVLGTATGTGAAAQNDAFAPVRAQIPADARAVLMKIRDHEVAHVNLLRGAIQQRNATAATYTPASFDFTGGNGAGNGPFAQATQSVPFLLAAAQAFEDLGTAAYKGQAGNLMSEPALLTVALQIHAVEARHAARIRYMRQSLGVTVKPWIVGTNSGITGVPAPGQALVNMIYEDEGNTQQLGIDITSLVGSFGGADAATASFDEPLDGPTVTAIIAPFVVGNAP